MDKPGSVKRLVSAALVALAIVLATVTPSQARGGAGHGVSGGHPGAVGEHHVFEGHRGFEGHRDFDRNRHDRFFGGLSLCGGYPYWGYPYDGYYPPAYGYSPPAYWYYCPSYGAYYPNVATCPEAWVPVPAS